MTDWHGFIQSVPHMVNCLITVIGSHLHRHPAARRGSNQCLAAHPNIPDGSGELIACLQGGDPEFRWQPVLVNNADIVGHLIESDGTIMCAINFLQPAASVV